MNAGDYARRVLIALAATAALGASVWLWYALMERSPRAVPRVSPLAISNPMLAAGTLLKQHGYTVSVEQRLSDTRLSGLPGGMLILADNSGQVNPVQAAQLIDWVRRGNTLLMQPKWVPVRPGDSAQAERLAPRQRLTPLTEPDPLGKRYGVGLSYRSKLRADCALPAAPAAAAGTADQGDAADQDVEQDAGADGEPDAEEETEEETAAETAASRTALRQLTCVTLPGGAYPLALDTGTEVLHALAGGPKPLWSDTDGASVRVYREGQGQVVMVSDNYFNNQRLPRYDHAELLLGVAGLNQRGRHVMLVLQVDAAPWYVLLWQTAWMPLSALALLLVLLLWRAARRFGPLLPEPSSERRALLEHIDASGNWLWRAAGGRDMLLAAARQESQALLRRRAPELQQLSADEQAARLARLCHAELADMRSALHGPAASQPAAFTRQIQLLQQVRHLYDRQ